MKKTLFKKITSLFLVFALSLSIYTLIVPDMPESFTPTGIIDDDEYED